MKTFAAIDIGSNAVRLLIKAVNEDEQHYNPRLTKSDYYHRIPIKFGRDVYTSRMISLEKEQILIDAMKRFRSLMLSHQVESYRACATSAFRDAANNEDVINRIYESTGIHIDIITGEEEAALVRQSYFAMPYDMDRNLLFADVGGGSTEVSFVSHRKTLYAHSFPIGSMRTGGSDIDASALSTLRSTLQEVTHGYSDLHIIGSGGNIRKMNEIFSGSDDTLLVHVSDIREIYKQLRPLKVEERMSLYNLPHERAEIIVEAAGIYATIADALGCKVIEAPHIGVRDGIIVGLQKDSNGYSLENAAEC